MTTRPDSSHALDGKMPSRFCIGHQVLGAGKAGRSARTIMKMLIIVILVAGFVGVTPTLAAEEKDGILRFTPETANDVVAQRVFHDQQGRVSKRIFYVPKNPQLRFQDRAKLTEADIVPPDFGRTKALGRQRPDRRFMKRRSPS